MICLHDCLLAGLSQVWLTAGLAVSQTLNSSDVPLLGADLTLCSPTSVCPADRTVLQLTLVEWFILRLLKGHRPASCPIRNRTTQNSLCFWFRFSGPELQNRGNCWAKAVKVIKFEVTVWTRTNFKIWGLFFGVLGPGVTSAASYIPLIVELPIIAQTLNYQRYRFRAPAGFYLISKHILIVAYLYYIEHIRLVL